MTPVSSHLLDQASGQTQAEPGTRGQQGSVLARMGATNAPHLSLSTAAISIRTVLEMTGSLPNNAGMSLNADTILQKMILHLILDYFHITISMFHLVL